MFGCRFCLMEAATYEAVLRRLMSATNSQSEAALASRLGVSSQAVYNARKKKQIPANWIFEVAKTFSVSSDWLFFGQEPTHTSNAQLSPQIPPSESEPSDIITRYAKLENKLETSEAERRELADENRQLHRDKEALLRENGELREKVARLEENADTNSLTAFLRKAAKSAPEH